MLILSGGIRCCQGKERGIGRQMSYRLYFDAGISQSNPAYALGMIHDTKWFIERGQRRLSPFDYDICADITISAQLPFPARDRESTSVLFPDAGAGWRFPTG